MPEKKAISRDAQFIKLWGDAGFDPAVKNACAKTAGYSPLTASKRTGKIINSLIQNKKMQRELKKAGVDMAKLASKLADLLEAKNYMIPARIGEDGKPIYAPDNFIQFKATEFATRLHDAIAPTRLEMDKRETKQIVFSAEVLHRFERYNAQEAQLQKADVVDVEPAGAIEG